MTLSVPTRRSSDLRLVLVGEPVDLGALGRTDHRGGDGRTGELRRGGEHGVAVDEHDRGELDDVVDLLAELLDVEDLAGLDLLLLATGLDHCVHGALPGARAARAR